MIRKKSDYLIIMPCEILFINAKCVPMELPKISKYVGNTIIYIYNIHAQLQVYVVVNLYVLLILAFLALQNDYASFSMKLKV